MKLATIPVLSCRLALLLAFGLAATASGQTRTLRIVTYNIEADINGYATNRPGLITPSGGGTAQQGGVLEGIGEEILGGDAAQPIDILALQEATSNTTTVSPIVNGLNTYYNAPGMYAMSTFQATSSGGVTSGGGPSGLIYNTTTVQLVASVAVDPPGGTSQLGSASGEYREVIRYEFAPAGVPAIPANEFYVYVSHYKSGTTSSDLAARNGEALIIRNDEAKNLPASARVLYTGDFNVTTSSEASYQTILAATATNGAPQGQGIDPLNVSGSTGINWGTSTTNPSILAMETESATNLRYRDDFEVMTTNVYYGTPGGLALVPGTYHVFGNNGTTHYNGTVGSGNSALTNLVAGAPISAATLYADLTTASDHLPVVADYTIPLPPAVGFTGGPTSGAAPLTVSFTNTTVGGTNYSWTFGDGHNSTLTNPANTYLSAGTYSVTLTASGMGGTNVVTRSGYIQVAVAPPVAGFAAGPTAGIAPLTVSFTNSSTGATNYSWAFGDGHTSTQTNAANTYVGAGTYSVTLTAVGPGGTNTVTATNLIVASFPPPVAAFTGGPTSGVAPLAVSFTNSSLGATSYSWDFGDGNMSTLTNAANIYTNPGLYSVTLTANGPGGTSAVIATNYVVVTYPPPVAGFTAGATNGTVPLTVNFTNLSTGATSYAWDFGDGNTSTLADAVNVYTNPGTFSVSLTAFGPGGSNTVTLANYIVAVSAPPAAGLALTDLLFLAPGGFQFSVTNNDGTAMTPEEQARISIYAADDPSFPFTNWTLLANPTVLTNGVLRVNDTNTDVLPLRFYRAVEAQ